MTEKQWNACTEPQEMLEFLRGKVSDRQLRLFAVACCRKVAHMLTAAALEGVELAERVAEGLADATQRRAGREKAMKVGWLMDDAYRSRRGPAKAAISDALGRQAFKAATDTASRTSRCVEGQCHLLRDVIGNPFRPLPPLSPSLLAWDDGMVLKLAQATYEHRLLPSGHLDLARLAVLADALEDAGCTDALLLAHLRSDGPHVRGCVAVDAVLGRA